MTKKKAELAKKVPSFKLASTGEKDFRLSAQKGRYTVLYFYPKDNTPGCTTEGLDFKAAHKNFLKLNADIFGVSRDSIASHKKFKEKQKFPFELLSDEDEEACALFDVLKMKNMYGKKFRGIERSTFLIDEKGKLIEEWRKVKVKGHVDEVLKTLKEHILS